MADNQFFFRSEKLKCKTNLKQLLVSQSDLSSGRVHDVHGDDGAPHPDVGGEDVQGCALRVQVGLPKRVAADQACLACSKELLY